MGPRVTYGVLALFLFVAPLTVNAQTVGQPSIASLLEQISQLTQLVVQLQAQLAELVAREQGSEVIQTDSGNITLPVYVHLITSPYATVAAQSTVVDIERIFRSGILASYWSKVGVTWSLQNVSMHQVVNGADALFNGAALLNDRSTAVRTFSKLAEGVDTTKGFHIFVVHDFGAANGNGVYLSDAGIAFVAETNSRDSGDAFLGYLMAHELGHGLGLEHSDNQRNLMHSGERSGVAHSERTELTPEQILNARKQSVIGKPFTQTGSGD